MSDLHPDDDSNRDAPAPALMFGQALRLARHARGVSLRTLAERAGVDFTYVSRVETGAFPPPAAATIVRLARALDADADELCALAGKLPPDIEAALLAQPDSIKDVRALLRRSALTPRGR